MYSAAGLPDNLLVFGKNLFLQVGDPKGVHQGYHEMTYTKFGRGRSFCKNEGGGGGGVVAFFGGD